VFRARKYNRQLLALALLGLLGFLAPPLILEFTDGNTLLSESTVLLVGDFGQGSYGAMTDLGVTQAQTRLADANRIRVIKIPVRELLPGITAAETASFDLNLERDRLRRQIIRRIATENVIAIIAANTSSTAEAVLEIGRTFSIPVLLTVATNDNLLSFDFSTVGFRLLPQDGKQAAAIVDWAEGIRASSEDGDTFLLGVAYDPRRYGLDLLELLRTRAGHTQVLPFPLGVTEETSVIIERGTALQVDAWVVAAYQSQAIEFYSKMKAHSGKTPLLFTDGAYGPWLADASNMSTYISFPSRPSSPGPLLQQLPGYAVYGYDALMIADGLLDYVHRARVPRKQLPQAIRALCEDPDRNTKLTQEYHFSSQGENGRASFEVYRVGELATPPLPTSLDDS